jgi:ribonuclease Z
MITLGFLGTGGSFSTAERDNTSVIIHAGRKPILVDCPGGVVQKVQKLGFHPHDITAIIVTHVHTDHVYGLPSFFHSLMLREGLVQVFGSQDTVSFCIELLDLFGLRKKTYRTQAEFHVVRSGKDFVLGDTVSIVPLRVRHHPSSLAYHFHFTEGPRFLYSGDTPADTLLLRKAGELDYLCHDCSAPVRFFEQYPILATMHTHSVELGRMAQEAGVNTLIPVHFFGEVEFSLNEIEEEIRKNYSGRLIIPKDFDTITIS